MKKGKDRINIVRNSVSNIEKEMEKLELEVSMAVPGGVGYGFTIG